MPPDEARGRDDLAHLGQGLFVVVDEVIGHPGHRRVHQPSAEVLGRDIFSVAAFTSGGPARKMVPLTSHDHGLVAHRRDVGTTRGR